MEYLRNDVDMLEVQKVKSTDDILKLNRIIDEFQSSLPQKRGEMAYMNEVSGRLDRTINDNTDYPYPTANWYSVDVSYTPMNEYWDKNCPR